MQYRNLYWFMRRQRRKIVKKSFNIFFEDVKIQLPAGESRKYDLIVCCKGMRLKTHMIQQIRFNKGFDSELEAAYTISHLAHAYLDQFGATVGTPIIQNRRFIYCVTSIYHRRKG